MKELGMVAIIGLLVALIACLLSGGVEVKTTTEVRVCGKKLFGKKRDM